VFSVTISDTPLDLAALAVDFGGPGTETGAIVSFTGVVRGEARALALEHYPGMTERCIEDMARSAARRWPIQAARIVHRVGELRPGEPIVWMAVASAHRAAAFSACEYLMDYLKVAAPLWKREQDAAGRWHWVEARDRDRERSRRWGVGPALRTDGANLEDVHA
jgi:molybdopterin synthase catalytic subunit